jgi:branched-chain amino acid transport system permease protein
MEILLQQVINGLVLGSMYALVALGYTMVYGIINLINFAHGDVLMVGALTSWSVASALEPWALPGWALVLACLLCSVVVCSALNFTIERLAYKPLRNAPRLTPLITAMGMSLMLQTLAMIVWKPIRNLEKLNCRVNQIVAQRIGRADGPEPAGCGGPAPVSTSRPPSAGG